MGTRRPIKSPARVNEQLCKQKKQIQYVFILHSINLEQFQKP